MLRRVKEITCSTTGEATEVCQGRGSCHDTGTRARVVGVAWDCRIGPILGERGSFLRHHREDAGGGKYWPRTYGEAMIITQPIGSSVYDFLTTHTPTGDGYGYISNAAQRGWTDYWGSGKVKSDRRFRYIFAEAMAKQWGDYIKTLWKINFLNCLIVYFMITV